MAAVELRNVSKQFPGGIEALRSVGLSAADGELLVVVGPSGCGKTTLLRLVAGLESPTAGEIAIGSRIVNRLPPQKRNVAMVFQSHSLYPTRTARGNLELPLKSAGISRSESAARIERAAGLLGIAAILDQKPLELSGGQRQRVAMGRAIVREPDVFLFDEPLSNLDAQLRLQIRGEIARLQRELKTTTIYVTHDQAEALALGDRIAVLHEGVLQQVGTGRELYEQPANTFVAGFLGSPGMNLFHTQLHPNGEPCAIEWGDTRLPLPANSFPAGLSGPVIAGIRPEHFRLQAAAGAVGCSVLVESVEFLGHETLVHFRSPQPCHQVAAGAKAVAGCLAARFAGTVSLTPESEAELFLDPAEVRLFDAAGNSLPSE